METEKKSLLISVIMPCFNAERYLDATIASVAAQTVRNWELLILDDGSTDQSIQIAEDWARRDSRIRLYRNPKNMGVARTRNRGLDLAAGDWIALLDSDDLWRPEKLARQLDRAARSGAKLLYTSYSMFSQGEAPRTYAVPPTVDYEGLLTENVLGCSTVMLSRQALGTHRFKPEFYHEDYALWLELLRSGVKAAGCTEVLTDWRIVANSRSFRKWSAAKNRWIIYRKAEGLSLLRAARAFAGYALRGLKKHKRL